MAHDIPVSQLGTWALVASDGRWKRKSRALGSRLLLPYLVAAYAFTIFPSSAFPSSTPFVESR